MKAWLKGGLIGAGIGIILISIALFGGEGGVILLIPLIPLNSIGFFDSLFNSDLSLMLIIFIIYPLIFFGIGALIGKSKNKNN